MKIAVTAPQTQSATPTQTSSQPLPPRQSYSQVPSSSIPAGLPKGAIWSCASGSIVGYRHGQTHSTAVTAPQPQSATLTQTSSQALPPRQSYTQVSTSTGRACLEGAIWSCASGSIVGYSHRQIHSTPAVLEANSAVHSAEAGVSAAQEALKSVQATTWALMSNTAISISPADLALLCQMAQSAEKAVREATAMAEMTRRLARIAVTAEATSAGHMHSGSVTQTSSVNQIYSASQTLTDCFIFGRGSQSPAPSQSSSHGLVR